ncbi:MAG: TRAP transporter substrate-binding protein DctP [Sphingomicrobium sp.]
MSVRAIFLAVLCMLACACSPRQPRGQYVLTYASPYPPTHPFSRADIEWMHYIEKQSGGRIAFRPFWSGSLISSDMSMTEIRHDVADIGLVTPIYARGGAHMLRVQSGFYGGVRDLPDQIAVYDCLAGRFPQFGKELAGLHVLAVQAGNFPGILTRSRPVKTLGDLRGLRLRAQSDAIDVLRQLGADPVNMPMGDVYSALAKGVIDGVVAPADTIKSLHFAEVAKNFTSIRFSRGAYPARAMSDVAWRRLPPDLQQLLLRSKPVWESALNSEILKAEGAGIKYGQQNGIHFSDIAPSEQQRFDELYNKDARLQAQRLAAVGVRGEPVFDAAQDLIHRAGTNAVQCSSGKHTNAGIRQ